jgi:SAM-dependent methyltransferase
VWNCHWSYITFENTRQVTIPTGSPCGCPKGVIAVAFPVPLPVVIQEIMYFRRDNFTVLYYFLVSFMSLPEKLLLSLSRDPDSADYPAEGNSYSASVETALSLLENAIPDFSGLVKNKKIADFGCGFGFQSCALAKFHTAQVVGIDSNESTLVRAWENARRNGLDSGKLTFIQQAGKEYQHYFDLVISQNSFEHFHDPVSILDTMKSLIKDDGKIIISFGPPWYAPYGSHMHYFCKVPWMHLLFSERTIMSVRSRYRNDGATRYEEVESGLNQMSIRKFENIIKDSKLKVCYQQYRCVKNMNYLGGLPVLRELFINHVSVVLSK